MGALRRSWMPLRMSRRVMVGTQSFSVTVAALQLPLPGIADTDGSGSAQIAAMAAILSGYRASLKAQLASSATASLLPYLNTLSLNSGRPLRFVACWHL